MGMSFVQAVLALTGVSEHHTPQPIAPAKGFVLDSGLLNPNCEQAKIYLNQKRHIEKAMVDKLMIQKLLLQERQTNNIVFPMYDENNNCVGAEIQGVTPKRFKGIKEGSKYGYGFNVRFSNDNTYDYALFFESAIDLISFMDYKKNIENKSLEKCILISMAGLKLNIVKHIMQAFECGKVVLCVDNDSAGQKFKGDIGRANIAYIDCPPDAKFKDWNEQLSAVKRRSVPVGRLLARGIASGDGRRTNAQTGKKPVLRKHERQHTKFDDR